MKKLYKILILVFCATALNAQPPNMEEMKTMKIGFITTQLNLTTEDAQKFWPIYNTYDKEKSALLEEERKIIEKIENNKNLSKEESLKSIDQLLQIRKKQNDIEISYKEKFLKVITAYQLAQLYVIDQTFHKMLMNRIRERRMQGGPPIR